MRSPVSQPAAKVWWHRESPFSPALPGDRTFRWRSAMISRVLAADVPSQVGSKIRVAGWLHRRRQLKSLTFLVIRDRTGLAQVVAATPEQIAAAEALPEETVLAVTGRVAASDQAPGGAEIIQPVITALSGPAEPPPFDLHRPR